MTTPKIANRPEDMSLRVTENSIKLDVIMYTKSEAKEVIRALAAVIDLLPDKLPKITRPRLKRMMHVLPTSLEDDGGE